MFTESQNFALVQTELDKVFYQGFDYGMFPGTATASTAEIFKPISTDKAAHIEEVYKGVGLYDIVGETEQVPAGTPKVANKLTTYVKDFAKSLPISKNLFDDGMFSVWSRSVEEMGRKAKLTQDSNAFKIFRNAFTTTLTADGVALISASHTLLGGGTTSNLVSGALTPDTLEDAIIALAQQKDQAGVTMGNVASILLVPTSLFKYAREITDSQLMADTADNNINIFKSAFGITVYTSIWLDAVNGGSDTAWFLMSRNHSVSRLIRQGLQTALRDWSISDNRTYLYQANFREEVFVTDYVGITGATGV